MNIKRWWNCYKGRLLKYKSLENIMTRGADNIRRVGYIADFRGYHCSRCGKYHHERVYNTKDTDDFVLVD